MRTIAPIAIALAGVSLTSAFAAAGNRRQLFRRKIEAANALVVEVAEIQAMVRPDDEAVWIGDLRVGVTRRAGAENRLHGFGCREHHTERSRRGACGKQRERFQKVTAFHDGQPYLAGGGFVKMVLSSAARRTPASASLLSMTGICAR